MELLSVIRRWHYRDHFSIREISRRTGLSRNTVRGVVTSTWIGAARGLEGPLISGRGGGSPCPERFVSQDAKRAAGGEMTLDVERVVNGGMKGQEALG